MSSSLEESSKLYYNIDIRYQESPNGLMNAEYTENRTVPLMSDCGKYYLTISRFSVPVSTLPIFIVDIEDGQANPNLTDYEVTLSFNTNNTVTDYKKTVIYVAKNSVASPATAIPKQVDSEYYYVYSYRHQLDMINTALASAYADLDAAEAQPQSEAPFFIFDEDSQKVKLITQYLYTNNVTKLGSGEVVPQIEIYVNEKLATVFLEAFDYHVRKRNTIDGKDYRFNIINRFNTNAYAKLGATIPLPPANPDYLIFSQEYVDLELWNDFSDLVFSTNLIPVIREDLASNDNISAIAENTPILTDFHPALARAGDSRSILTYFPQGPYRLLDMYSQQPLDKLDVKLWWKSKKDGKHRELKIGYNQVLNLKFLFIKKSSFTS